MFGKMIAEEASVVRAIENLVKAPNSRVDKVWILSRAGSRAYGTATETSDFDYRGVYRAPEIEDFFRQEVQHPIKVEPHDANLTAQVSFLKQLQKGSFTAIEVLWDENPLILDPLFKETFWKSDRFLTSALIGSYWGCFNSYRDFILLNSEVENPNTIDKLRKAIYHSFRNLEKIRMICEPGAFQLKSRIATFLVDIRNGVHSVKDVLPILKQTFEEVTKISEEAHVGTGLLDRPSYEELFALSGFMRH